MARTTWTVELADGAPIEVTPDLRDSLAAEAAFRKNKHWGSTSDNAIRFAAYNCWSAARREGKTTMEWTEWIEGGVIDLGRKPEPDADDDGEPYPVAAEAVASLGEGTRPAESPS